LLGQKNRLMLILLASAIALSVIIHGLQRMFQLFTHTMLGMSGHAMTGAHGTIEAAYQSPFALNALLILPILLFAWSWYDYRKQADHPAVPLLNVLGLTFSSISMIAGGGGTVEFHFSIFMVIACMAYYENIQLIIIASALFAVQHLAGWLFVPQYVFGVDAYPFVMVLSHAVFLLLTAAATIWQIVHKRKATSMLELAKEMKEAEAARLLDTVMQLSRQLGQSSTVVTEMSDANSQSNHTILDNFKEVGIGLESQSASIQNIETGLIEISERTQHHSQSFTELNRKAELTKEALNANGELLAELFVQIRATYKLIGQTSSSMQTLNDSAQHIERIIQSVQDIANQTKLLALNASIEAARAGEHGSGFAVVATEIRKLADQSNRATIEIGNMLTAIRKESQESVLKVDEGNRSMEHAVQLTETSITSLARLIEEMQHVTRIIESLDATVKEMEARTHQISTEMINIASITEENVAAVQELLDKTEMQANANRKVDEELEHLSALSMTLQKQFTA